MKILDLIYYSYTNEEKRKADEVNIMLRSFCEANQLDKFPHYRQFHTEKSNNPCGNRVIFIENMGYTLVRGDGDKGLGWIIDGVVVHEREATVFSKYILNKRLSLNYTEEDWDEIGFINELEIFLDYILKEYFNLSYTSKDVLKYREKTCN
ncbi:MAG: hypothetical protein E7263_00010 [Lachnospiraceae bacterium]|nr:hypothetical protein [Lachnospiraceae bacterium]